MHRLPNIRSLPLPAAYYGKSLPAIFCLPASPVPRSLTSHLPLAPSTPWFHYPPAASPPNDFISFNRDLHIHCGILPDYGILPPPPCHKRQENVVGWHGFGRWLIQYKSEAVWVLVKPGEVAQLVSLGFSGDLLPTDLPGGQQIKPRSSPGTGDTARD